MKDIEEFSDKDWDRFIDVFSKLLGVDRDFWRITGDWFTDIDCGDAEVNEFAVDFANKTAEISGHEGDEEAFESNYQWFLECWDTALEKIT